MSLTPPILHCACCCENQNTLKYLLSIRDKADKKNLPLRRLRIPRSKNHQKLPRNRQFRNVVLRNLENVCSGYAEHDVRFPSWRCSINWRQCCAFVLPIVNFSIAFLPLSCFMMLLMMDLGLFHYFQCLWKKLCISVGNLRRFGWWAKFNTLSIQVGRIRSSTGKDVGPVSLPGCRQWSCQCISFGSKTSDRRQNWQDACMKLVLWNCCWIGDVQWGLE